MMGFKTRAMKAAEAQVREPLDQYLRREMGKRPMLAIATELKVSKSTINYWLLKYGIQKRWE